MLTPNELEVIPKPLEKQFKILENRIMQDVVRRLKNAEQMTASAEHQIASLLSSGVSQEDIKKLIGDTLEISQKEVDNIYNGMIAKGYTDGMKFAESLGKTSIPYKDNKELQQLITAVKAQTNGTFKNITQSLGFAVKQNGKSTFKPIADYYQSTLDGAVLDITSGAFDYNTVLKRVVSEMTYSGLRTVDYESGWSNRVDVAVRRAVMTGVNQVTAKISEQNMDILETEYVEVSWHAGARPAHQVWQGKIYHWNRGKKSENSGKTVDNSAKSGIINYRKSNDNKEENTKHYYQELGKIDISDNNAIAKSLKEFEEKYIDSDTEHCCIITTNGEVYEVHGDKYMVDTSLLGDKLKGSINEHNHVKGESQYSFSWEDLISSINDGTKVAFAYDEKYRYSMVFPDTSISEDEVYEIYQKAKYTVLNDIYTNPKSILSGDEQHERIKRACEELGIKYQRVTK